MSHNSVINWVKQAAKMVQKISKKYQDKEKVDILELDEMCTMLKKNGTKSGYGLPQKELRKTLKDFMLEIVQLQVSSNFRIRLKIPMQNSMQQMIGNYTISQILKNTLLEKLLLTPLNAQTDSYAIIWHAFAEKPTQFQKAKR